MINKQRITFMLLCLFLTNISFAQEDRRLNSSKFKQLETELPTPNNYRTGSGAPGHEYWQQKADYDIKVALDEDKKIISGVEKITYSNNSPDELLYLWVQLDQNMRAQGSDTYLSESNTLPNKMTTQTYDHLSGYEDYDGGHKIAYVKDKDGNELNYVINKTMMRIDLPTVLKTGEQFELEIKWHYNINDRLRMGGRGGYETFEEDGNTIFTITQWFPRMAVYHDAKGWQHKQFLGRGEFALTFGDYHVEIEVPADHIVASTGELKNAKEVLTSKQLERFETSKTADKPVMIVTQKEAEKAEKKKSTETKTWIYEAENVRDFAFGSSRKFIWDAMGVKIGDRTVMAMSYYPKEANPLYETYSTEAVAHTLRVYSKYTIDYPYPVAISVEARNGMEYPMICFNYGRPEEDGTYSDRIKYGMISVVIHEVGHNFFPMIVNSDERQWTWMDEGLNSFVQYLAESEWQTDYPSRRGPAYKIADYMGGPVTGIMPIMTNSESIPQFGNNAYGKPATALNILRETVMGRELFDFAFKEYARRWAFKHPEPADFFRTMEDASGVDLDWFWRGWFYTTDHVDISLEKVTQFVVDTKNPEVEKAKLKKKRDAEKPYFGDLQNEKYIPTVVMEAKPELKDFYNSYDPLDVTEKDKADYKKYLGSIGDEEKELIAAKKYFYQLDFKNVGGLIMPVIVEVTFEDGTEAVFRFPAELWKMNNKDISKVLILDKPASRFVVDPYRETADTDKVNNIFPRELVESKFEVYKREKRKLANPMQDAQK